jgi:putative flippase GtrA
MPLPSPGQRTPVQFLKFLVVGGFNTVFGYAVFAGLVLSGVPPVPALVLTYMVGVPFNFFTTRRFVFAREATRREFFRFVLAYIVVYLFNQALYALFAMAGAAPLIAQAVCIPVVAVFSFLLFKLHVFRDAA